MENVFIDKNNPMETFRQRLINAGYESFLKRNDGASKILDELRRQGSIEKSENQYLWRDVGHFYRLSGRPFQAVKVLQAFYEEMCQYQIDNRKWIKKTRPLVWLYETYKELGYRVHARRYAMLTMCEQAIKDEGRVKPDDEGIYFRLAWELGLSDEQITKYSDDAFSKFSSLQEAGWFPERVLLELDTHWISELPEGAEFSHYVINLLFSGSLLKRITNSSESDGTDLEILSQYLFSCLPGVRTYRRLFTHSTDYDVMCVFEGFSGDYRDELGRYVICECKDWSKAVNFTSMAKFSLGFVR